MLYRLLLRLRPLDKPDKPQAEGGALQQEHVKLPLLLDHDWVGVRNALRDSLRLAGKVNRCAWSEEVQRDIQEHEKLPGRTIDSCGVGIG